MVLFAAPTEVQLASLEERLGYTFANRSRLVQALQHSSCGHLNNQRLAWLGDGLTKAILSDEVLHRLPAHATLGQLNQRRTGLETQASLAALAENLGLDQLLVVGGGFCVQPSPRVLCEAFEAVLGAVFLDSGRQLAPAAAVFWALVDEQEG